MFTIVHAEVSYDYEGGQPALHLELGGDVTTIAGAVATGYVVLDFIGYAETVTQ